jgi:hypothetical protein
LTAAVVAAWAFSRASDSPLGMSPLSRGHGGRLSLDPPFHPGDRV